MRAAREVELRMAGMTQAEIARALKVSRQTLWRDRRKQSLTSTVKLATDQVSAAPPQNSLGKIRI